MIGSAQGKYDEECTFMREHTRAEGVVLVVLNGERGTGFSVQGPMHVHAALPDVLEHIAREIRKFYQEQTQ